MPLIFARPKQLAPNLVVGDLWHHHRRVSGFYLLKPVLTFRSFSRTAWASHQTERAAIEQYDLAHQLFPFCSFGKSLWSGGRFSSSA